MAWYRSGTVTVANGSPTVTGAGTDFVSNTTVGEVLLGSDGRVYEIAQVVSATQLTIIPAYQGASAGGQAYGIQPTQSFVRDLALNAATLLNTFGAVRDGIGQGLIGDGSSAAPGIRFAADQDTGLRRVASNVLALTTGGQDILTLGTYCGIGTGAPLQKLHVNNSSNDPTFTLTGNNSNGLGVGVRADGFPAILSFLGGFAFGGGLGGAATEFGRFDGAGNLLVGVTSGNEHRTVKQSLVNNGSKVASWGFSSGSPESLIEIYSGASGSTGSSANATFKVNADGQTGRSINAKGTINASGADYAEYMTKAAGCGMIAPGDVCGVDKDGHLTKTWSDAVSFVVKSTDPAYVGGDSWAAHLPARPDAPGAEPSLPIAPDAPPEIEDEAALVAWRRAAAAYSEQMTAYPAARAAWQAATDAYARDLAVWDAALEAERAKVDRIAFCGQVPVNVTGDFAAGDYLIAAAAGAGIKAVAVAEADITFDQYRRRLGKVWAVRDGRAWVDVQHG